MSDETTTETTSTTDTPPARPPPPAFALPEIPDGYRRLAIYSPIWPGRVGEPIHGDLLSSQICELPDFTSSLCVMVCLASPLKVLRFDEKKDREELAQARTMVAVPVPMDRRAALGRLLAFTEKAAAEAQNYTLEKIAETGVQRVSIHAVPHEGGGTRFVVFIANKTTRRGDVDPMIIAAIEEAKQIAARAAGR